MYAAHFGLTHPPFSIAPDPRFLFMSERHREALAHLLYGVESGGGFVLLTGEIGAGKTTVCRRFLEQAPKHARVAYIFNPKLTVGDLLQTICDEFGVPVRHQGPGPATVKDHLDPLNAQLLQSHARGEHSLLIIDEAQGLSVEVLEQLRLLTNLETDQRKLLQIILIGQPELRQMLARPELEQLAQRVTARFHLGALSEHETRDYVAHRMGVAGWQGEVPFKASALKRVYQLTAGVPRRVNLLCDRALLGAYAAHSRHIDQRTVEQAAKEVFDSPAPIATRSWRGPALGALVGAGLVLGGGFLWRGKWLSPAETQTQTQLPLPTPAPALPATALPALAQAQAPNAVSNTQASAAVPAFATGLPPPSAWFQRENQAFAALSPLWGQALSEEEPCAQAQQNRLQCYRTPRMTAHGLQQMDRPAALQLALPGQRPGYLLVTAVQRETVELVDAQNKRWRLPLSELGSAWQGQYISLWRTPPGQIGRLHNGFQGPAAPWMEKQLSQLQAAGKLPRNANSLKEKVAAFQRASGIDVNGIASPTTLMLINKASGVAEPRLLAITP